MYLIGSEPKAHVSIWLYYSRKVRLSQPRFFLVTFLPKSQGVAVHYQETLPAFARLPSRLGRAETDRRGKKDAYFKSPWWKDKRRWFRCCSLPVTITAMSNGALIALGVVVVIIAVAVVVFTNPTFTG